MRFYTKLFGSNIAGAFARDRSGVSAVEFAFLAAPFLLILFAIIETSVVFIGQMTLTHATTRTARLVRTGEAATSAMTPTQFKQTICDGVDMLLDCSKLQIDLAPYAKFSDVPTRAPVTNGSLDTGGFQIAKVEPSRIMALRTFYKWPLYADMFAKYLSNLNDGSFLLSSVMVIQVEPFKVAK